MLSGRVLTKRRCSFLSVRLRSSVAAAPSHTTEYYHAKPFSEIPGPKGLPYIGTMLQYRKGPFNKYDIHRYHDSLSDLYNTYGNIVKETIAGTTVVHLYDPDYIRTMFTSEGKMPHTAPLMETSRLYRKERGLALGLGNTNGEEWYKLRSAVQQMMMRPKAVTVYLPFVNSVADDFIQRLHTVIDKDGHVDDLKNEIAKWNVESAAMTAFESRLHCLSDAPETEVQKMITANADTFAHTAKIKFKLPLYKLVVTPTWLKLKAAEECVMRTSKKYLDKAVANIGQLAKDGQLEDGQYNFLTYLLSRKELTKKDVGIIILSLFGDGISTTVPTLASNLYCLARNPDVQQKVFEEIQRVIPPGAEITAEMINELSYLKAFVKETFRFFPIGLEVTRIPQQNLVVGGYQIPAGTRVEFNNFVMLQDSKYFDSPEEFRPERWLRGGSAQYIHPYILTPFSHGPRMCVGRRFVEQEMYVVLVKMLQNFKLEWKHQDLGQVYRILMILDAPVDITFKSRG